ncbi:MAG: hypothetical protein ACYC7K_00455 [Desulfobacteria bacterium]
MSKRLDKFFDEIASVPIDFQATYDRAMIVTGKLIDNLAARIDWNERENSRLTRAALARGETPPAPESMAGEMETLGRIVATLNDDRLDSFRKKDPDAGAREIVRVLQLAREEFSNVKAETPVKEGGQDKVPAEEMEGGEGEAVKTAQNFTLQAEEAPRIERGPEISRLCLSRGKVRRGSG